MTDEYGTRHIDLRLRRGARSMIVVSPVETSARVVATGAPRSPHPTDRNTVFDTSRRGKTEIRAEISERRLPALARSSLCVFTHQLAIVVRSRPGDDAVMLLGPGWWQIVRRRDGVPTSITTRTGDAVPALAAELSRSGTPVTVIGENPAVPVGAGRVIWYPYAAFAFHRAVRRLNLVRATRRSVRRARVGATLALIWFVVATSLAVLRAPESYAYAKDAQHSGVSVPSEITAVSDVPDSTVAQDLVRFARALSGRLKAERIEFGHGEFLAIGALVGSRPSVIDHLGLELRRIDVTDTTTRVVVAMTRSAAARVTRSGHRTTPSDHGNTVRGVSLSTIVRSVAESCAVEITSLRHVYDDELAVTFLGTPDGILSVVFGTDRAAQIVRLTIEPADDLMQMMYVVAPGGSHDR